MADSRTSKSSDGLIYPPGIPTDDLKPESITSAADALDLVAGKVSASADGVDTAWTPISASFVAPDAQIVYGGMAPATASTRTVASKLTKVAAALRTYGQELVAVKKSLEAVKSEAAKWLASDFDSENRVWVLAHRTKAYEWDIQVSKVNIVTDPFEYLRGRGETVREGWLGYPEIRAYWRESGDHVERNNELLDKVADAYAKLNALQVECANAINALRDTAGEKLKAIDAEALKIGGEHAADLPWGKQAEHERTCTENFGQGAANTGISLLNFVGVNYEGREWSWTWDTAGRTWGGLLDGANSLIATVNPLVWGLALLGDKEAQKLWGDSSAKSLEMLKGIVSWDKWFTNPAEAAGEVAAGFVPIAGWAGKGSKLGAGARALASDTAEAIAKRAAAAGERVTRLLDDLKNPKPPKVDVADGVKGPHAGEGPRVEMPDRNGSQAPHVERGGETGGGPKHDGDSAGQGSPGHHEGDSGNGSAGDRDPAGNPKGDSGHEGSGEGSHGDGGQRPDPGKDTGGPDGSGGDSGAHPSPVDAGPNGPDHGPGWERTPADQEKGYVKGDGDGRTYPDNADSGPYPVKNELNQKTWDLIADPDAPYGRDYNTNQPLTKAEYDERFAKPGAEEGRAWWRYPSNDGAVPGSRVVYSDPAEFLRTYGVQVDRIGKPDGKYLGLIEDGKPASFEQRGLPVASLEEPYHQYRFTEASARLIKEDGLRIEISRIAPAFGREGGGLQVRVLEYNGLKRKWTEVSVDRMIDKGYLE